MTVQTACIATGIIKQKTGIPKDYQEIDIDEDISCGSANCSLLPLWSKLMNTSDDKEFTISSTL